MPIPILNLKTDEQTKLQLKLIIDALNRLEPLLTPNTVFATKVDLANATSPAAIRAELEAGGSAPLNVINLLGNTTFTASTAPAHQFATGLITAGALTFGQPAAADLTDGTTGQAGGQVLLAPATLAIVAHTITIPKLTGGGANGAITWNAIGSVQTWIDPT